MTACIDPDISSPCVGVCQLGADGYCEGCLRCADEIAQWTVMDERERRRIMVDVLTRRSRLPE